MVKKLILIALFIINSYRPVCADAEYDYIEDIFNRYGGPPLYKYYHHLPSHRSQPSSVDYDANRYWESRYYGNEEPDPYEIQQLDRELMDMEGMK